MQVVASVPLVEVPGAAGDIRVDNRLCFEAEVLTRENFTAGADGRHVTNRLCFAVDEGEATEAWQRYHSLGTEPSS